MSSPNPSENQISNNNSDIVLSDTQIAIKPDETQNTQILNNSTQQSQIPVSNSNSAENPQIKPINTPKSSIPYSLPQMVPVMKESPNDSRQQPSLVSNPSQALQSGNMPLIGDFPPHSIFSCSEFPKTGGRLGRNILLWGNESSTYFPFICMIGPHYMFNICTFVFVICFNGAFLWYSCFEKLIYGVIASLCCLILTLISLCMTSFSNPGIVPRGMVYTGKEPPISICSHCKVERPRGCYHCQDCDCCYLQLDHHCPWMGKCVAKNNLRWFFLTLTCIFSSFIINAAALFFEAFHL